MAMITISLVGAVVLLLLTLIVVDLVGLVGLFLLIFVGLLVWLAAGTKEIRVV